MTMCCAQVCDVNSLVPYLNVINCDIWEGNVTTRGEILIEHIHFPVLWNIREGVTL